MSNLAIQDLYQRKIDEASEMSTPKTKKEQLSLISTANQ